MTDSKNSQEPTFDFNTALSGALKWVQTQKVKSQTQGKQWGWVMGLIAAAIVFSSLAFLAYSAWKKGREIAKLKHEIDVDEEEKHQKFKDMEIAKEVDLQKQLQHDYNQISLDVEQIRTKIKTIEKERQQVNVLIDYITDWGGIDEYFK